MREHEHVAEYVDVTNYRVLKVGYLEGDIT